MMNKVFDEQYKKLNKAQKEAVDTIEGPVMVMAGPGTGKTTILTLRIANILRQTDTAPENILALTFTESGAMAMRNKLLRIVGATAYKINIHTFHGFAMKIIEQYPDYFPRIIGSKIITETTKLKIIEQAVADKKIKLLRPFGDRHFYVRHILREIQILKRENISPKRFIEDVTDTVSSEYDLDAKKLAKNKELATIYKFYEKKLAENKLYDFEDMLIELVKTMEGDRQFKLVLQEQYQYILADEHQDANATQNRILELLSDFHDMPNLFIVGDDRQAIYRFQGASLENFLYFVKKYKGAKVIDLNMNYRSYQNILDISHTFIAQNPSSENIQRQKLRSMHDKAGVKIQVVECYDKDTELHYLAGSIEELLKKGTKANEIAVLYRENGEAQAIGKILGIRGIRYKIESDRDILNDPIIFTIITICKAINNPSDSEALARALFLKEMQTDIGVLSSLYAMSNREKVPLFTLVSNNNSHASIQTAYKRIIAWSHKAQITPFRDFLPQLLDEMGIMKTLMQSDNSLEKFDALQNFYDDIVKESESRQNFYLTDFIEYIDIVAEHGMKGRRDYGEYIDGVRLMTAHRSKGLEFEHVFIVNVVDKLWGNKRSTNLFTIPTIEHARNIGRIEDERRLFYVAMTRAKYAVNISYALHSIDKELVPSQFVTELEPTLTDRKRIPKKENLLLTTITARSDLRLDILDKEFVRNKFLAQPLSVTHLNNYLECPWRYFFVDLLRMPQNQNKHQLYGTVIHLTLKNFFDEYKEHRDMSKKALLASLKVNMEKQIMPVDDRRESIEKGIRALTGYYDKYYPTWNRRLATEYSVKTLLQDGAMRSKYNKDGILHLTGKLDKIEFFDDVAVNVVDYKTGKQKSRNVIEGKTKNSDGNYKRQLVFYKLLLENDGKYKMRSGEIDFIEPDDKGKYRKELFDIHDAEVRSLETVIFKVVQEITNLEFLDRRCDDEKCEYCKLAP